MIAKVTEPLSQNVLVAEICVASPFQYTTFSWSPRAGAHIARSRIGHHNPKYAQEFAIFLSVFAIWISLWCLSMQMCGGGNY